MLLVCLYRWCRMFSLHRIFNKPLPLLDFLMFLCNTGTCVVVQTITHTSYTFIHPQSSTKSTMIKKTKLLVCTHPDLLYFFPSIFSISIKWVVMVEHMVPWDPGCRIAEDTFKCIHKIQVHLVVAWMVGLNCQLLFKPGSVVIIYILRRWQIKYCINSWHRSVKLCWVVNMWHYLDKNKDPLKMVQSAIKFEQTCHFSNRNKRNKYYSIPNHVLYILQ